MNTVQDIFLAFYDEYRATYGYNHDYHKVANAIINCKSGVLGRNVSICDECGNIEYHNNSCRNRHCPGCQAIPRLVWIDARKAEVINGVSYFHAVFTIPAELNPLVFANQKILYSLFHECVSQTLLELSEDPKYLGAKPGITQVLHTWGSKLNYHPHIHTIIMGCGLTKTFQVVEKSDFYIPVGVLSRKFRGKFMALLKESYANGKLVFPHPVSHLEKLAEWNKLVNLLYNKEWVPFIKETFNGSGNAIEYLGKYTHRIAISNHRICEVTNSTVTFSYKDYNDDTYKDLTISGVEFVRRFLMHVLPKGFVKIRHYGAFNNRQKKKILKIIRDKMALLECKAVLAGLKVHEILKKLFNVDITRCPKCNSINYHTRQINYLRN